MDPTSEFLDEILEMNSKACKSCLWKLVRLFNETPPSIGNPEFDIGVIHFDCNETHINQDRFID